MSRTRYRKKPVIVDAVMWEGDEDYTGEAREMDGIEEEHQGDADVARYERSNKEGEEEFTTIEVDIPDDEESHKAIIALGLRLAILQGIYDVTYTEIAECLEDNFSHRKINPE